jgi:hypothetical protein
MGKAHGRSGGGIEGKNVVETQNPKQHVRPRGVSVGAVSRLGGMVGEGADRKPLYYNNVAYTTPEGPIPVVGANCKPGGGRRVLASGSQSATPKVSDPPRGKPHW